MDIQNKTKEELINELQVLLQENNSLKKQNEKRTVEFVIANKELLFQNEKKEKRAEENEIKFRNLFENSPVGKSITGIDGSLLVNQAFCNALGYSKKELETKKWQEITCPEDIEKSDKIVQSLLQGINKKAHFKKRYVHKYGNIIYAEVSTFLQRDNDNKPIHFITSFNDITVRKQAEKEREQFFNFFNVSPDIMVIADSNGAFRAVNPTTTALLGYSEGELLSKPFIDFIHPDDKQSTLDEMASQIKIGSSLNFENRYKRKNGSYILLSWCSYFNKKEGITYATARDVTNERMIEIKLINEKERAEESEKQIKYSQGVAKIGYYQVDVKKGFWTSSEMLDVIFGIDKEYIRNIEGWGNLICPEFKLKMTEYFNNEILLKNSSFNKEYKIINQQTKKEIWVHGLGELKYDELGNLIQMFGTIQDITDKKNEEIKLIEAKEHAEESDRLKSAFLANMSHEIRTPMNGILGFSDLLKTPNLSGEVQQQYIRIIEKSGMRMLNIINDIISISKIESGVMEANLKASNINEQIEYIDTLFKPEAEAKGITLSFNNSLSLKEAIVKTDHEKLNAILASLVKNAIKYTQSGSIELGYTKKAKQLQFYVKDTGIGIDKDRQKAIFERFIQADIFDENALQGAGLGLSISKAYVEMLGGKIWVESEIGKGSIFYFTLPYDVETKAENESITDNSDRELEMPLKKMKILIVDDDEKSSWLLGLMLKKLYKQVLYAENGLEAVEVCRNNPDIDLILMDIQMPVMNGYEATRQIREFNNEVVIITQTAFALSGDREKLLAAGCNDYISKPINKAELLALIHRYFNK